MRMAVMAAGALGGYFGARMAAAGHEVYFIARGAKLETLKANGLKIESVLGDVHVAKPNVTDDPTAVGPVDVVLFTVKLWDTERAAEFTRSLVGPGTRVITLQNGIDSAERITPILGKDYVVAGSAYIAATMVTPGVVSHTSKFARIVCGRSDGKADARLEAFAEAARRASIEIDLSKEIDRERWQKFTFLIGLSGATASTRKALGPILADPDTRSFFNRLMREAVAVGRAMSISLPADYADDRMKFADASPPDFKASMLHDLERGNRLELDWLAGKIVELGRSLGIPTPANEAVYAVLKLSRMGSAARPVNSENQPKLRLPSE
jgi:2-dehydropantoate 2-reductase